MRLRATPCFFTLLISCIAFISMSAAQEWSEEIDLELPGLDMTITPDFDIDPNTGHLHIVTMISPRGVLYTEMDGDGNILQQYPIDHAELDKHGNGYYYGATVTVDNQGYPHICYRHYYSGDPPKFSSYYTYYDGSQWVSPAELSIRAMRGWMLRMDVDKYGKVHIARGSMANVPGEELAGPVKYFRFFNGSLEAKTDDDDDFYRYRADDRLELDASYENQVHVILGCPDYPPQGGPVWYWRSFDGGVNWTKSEIHDVNAKGGNGAPDLFVDASGNVHIIYGSELDKDVGNKASVRYTRFENDNHLFDVPVTDQGEIIWRYDTPQGIGSVAASDDGEIVIVVYSETFGGRLFARESRDGGQSWSDPTEMAESSCGSLGRNRHVIRAISDKFYLLYPSPTGVKLRYKKFTINQPPVAHAGGPYSGSEGTTIQLNASGSTDPEGPIAQYEWDYDNDSIYDETTTSPFISYTYNDDYSGQISVRVTDSDNDKNAAQANITIANVAPTANAGGPYNGDIDETINFQGSGSDPGADVLSYSWDLDGDGIFETQGQTAQRSFSTGGTYQVTFKVTDDDDGTDTDIAQVSIQNMPPQIALISNQTIDEGGAFTDINLNDAVSDPDNTDDQISWSYSTTQHLNLSITGYMLNISVKDAEWNGTETVTLTATDPGGESANRDISFTVNPVNDPPVIQPIVVNPINEGEQFLPISLSVIDPDNEQSEIQWNATGQQQLVINIRQSTGATAQVTIPNENWYGSEQVTFTATDQNGAGLSDSETTTLTVINVNDPPMIRPALDQSIRYNQDFQQVNLDTCVDDVDTPSSQIQWSYSGNSNLSISIVNRLMTITRNDPNWIGIEQISFTANDGQLSDSYDATYTVVYHNDPPQISNILSEVINENGSFETLYLDDKVDDPDHADNELTWSISDNVNLQFDEIGPRIFQPVVADSEWAGSETIKFVVSDPENLCDSTYATYTVMPVNDPPKLNYIPNFTFYEDSTYNITSAELELMVSDPDHEFSELSFTFENNNFTDIRMEEATGNLVISADENWFGTENPFFVVTDALYGKASQPVKVTVKPVPDPPQSFDLIIPFDNSAIVVKPEKMDFSWRRAIDPDGETVSYSWNLSKEQNFAHIIDQRNGLTDTVFTFTIPEFFDPGIYYWKVIATDQSGNSTDCNSVNLFRMDFDIGISEDANAQTPKDFALFQNYPNPFNPETRISYQLPQSSHVKLAVYNGMGQLINMLVDEQKDSGHYSVIWNGRNENNEKVTSGIYIYKLVAEDFVSARKMILLQ